MPTKRSRIDEIEAREKAATKGPWEYIRTCFLGRTEKAADFEFISHAREDIPWLLERVRGLEFWLARMIERAEMYEDHHDRSKTIKAARAELAKMKEE